MRTARCRPSLAACGVTSSSSTRTPAFAKCAAICAPITPAPSTAASRTLISVASRGPPARRRGRPPPRGRRDRRSRPPATPANTSACSGSSWSPSRRAPPKNSFAARVALISGGTTPDAWPATRMPRMMPRYSRSSVAEKRSMNLVDCRSSTWKTTARLRSRPRRSRCTRAMVRSCSTGSRSGADAGAAVGDRLAHRLLEDRDEQVVLALEIEVDGAGGDAGGAGDVGDLGGEEPAFREDVGRGAEDRLALVAARLIDLAEGGDAGH